MMDVRYDGFAVGTPSYIVVPYFPLLIRPSPVKSATVHKAADHHPISQVPVDLYPSPDEIGGGEI